MPNGRSDRQRVIDGDGDARRETWRFLGDPTASASARTSRSDYDPRQRPWYVGHVQSRRTDADRTLSLCVVERGRHIGRRADAGWRGDRLRSSLGTLSPPDRPYKLDAQLDHHGRDRRLGRSIIESRPCDPTDATACRATRRCGAACVAPRLEAAGPSRPRAMSRLRAVPTSCIVHPIRPMLRPERSQLRRPCRSTSSRPCRATLLERAALAARRGRARHPGDVGGVAGAVAVDGATARPRPNASATSTSPTRCR